MLGDSALGVTVWSVEAIMPMWAQAVLTVEVLRVPVSRHGWVLHHFVFSALSQMFGIVNLHGIHVEPCVEGVSQSSISFSDLLQPWYFQCTQFHLV